MHLIKAGAGSYHFQISSVEKRALFAVISQYPLVPAAHHRLTHTLDRPSDQELLEESLNEYRRTQRKHVEAMLRTKSRFQVSKGGWRFSLKTPQMEWLLQVLNDVRVGSWLALGSPENPREMLPNLNEQTARRFWMMEAAGLFQSILLGALESGAPPGTSGREAET